MNYKPFKCAKEMMRRKKVFLVSNKDIIFSIQGGLISILQVMAKIGQRNEYCGDFI